MSLRVRVVCLIGVVLLLSMALGTFVAGVQARAVLRAELNSGLNGAEQTVKSAYEDLPNSDHQGRDMHQLVATFDGNRHVRAALVNADGSAFKYPEERRRLRSRRFGFSAFSARPLPPWNFGFPKACKDSLRLCSRRRPPSMSGTPGLSFPAWLL